MLWYFGGGYSLYNILTGFEKMVWYVELGGSGHRDARAVAGHTPPLETKQG